MAGLLAAHVEAFLPHALDHMQRSPTAVRSGVSPRLMRCRFRGLEVRHHGGDDARLRQSALDHASSRRRSSIILIAVDQVALRRSGSSGRRRRRERCRCPARISADPCAGSKPRRAVEPTSKLMLGSPLGSTPILITSAPSSPQRFGRDLVTRAIGAVDDHAQAFERHFAGERPPAVRCSGPRRRRCAWRGRGRGNGEFRRNVAVHQASMRASTSSDNL